MAGVLKALVLTGTSPFPHRSFHFPAYISVNVTNRLTPFHRKQQSIPKGCIIIRANLQSNQANGGGYSNWTKPLMNFASKNFLPLALVGGVALGLANPTLGYLADSYNLSKFSTFGIFAIAGLTLRTEEIGATTEAWPIGLFGLVSILLLTPLFSRLIMQLRLQPQEFVTGLAIFSCMPTTLSSGVALTRLIGGNSALALAMTVISNLLGILIVPFSISRFIASGVGISIPTKQLLKNLIATLLVPIILGKAFGKNNVVKAIPNACSLIFSYWSYVLLNRFVVSPSKSYILTYLPLMAGLADFADRNSKLWSMTSAILLSLVPWMQVSKSRSLLMMVKPETCLIATGMGVLLHLILLAFNALCIQSLSVVSGGSSSVFSKKQNVTALLIVASQKTLPVMVAVVQQLGGALGDSSLLVLPCVAAHLNQIIVDSFLVSFWLQKEQSLDNIKTA